MATPIEVKVDSDVSTIYIFVKRTSQCSQFLCVNISSDSCGRFLTPPPPITILFEITILSTVFRF